MWPFTKRTIRITQRSIPSAYAWLETIFLVDDRELDHVSDWTVGYYHCIQCDTFRGFAYELHPKHSPQVVSPQAHNERNAFWRTHAHGDGRILLFEKDMIDNANGAE